MWMHELQSNVIWQRKPLLIKHALALHLLEHNLLSPKVPIINRFGALSDFQRVVIKPLHTLHIELKLTITELLYVRNCEQKTQFFHSILKKFQISVIVCLVFCHEVEFVNLKSIRLSWM